MTMDKQTKAVLVVGAVVAIVVIALVLVLAPRSSSSETTLQNATGNTNTQSPEENANQHSVPRSYCMPDGSGWKVFVWSRKEWSPSVVRDVESCPVRK